MILPLLHGILGWRAVPVTWLILLSSTLTFILISPHSDEPSEALEKIVRDEYILSTQGLAYAQYLRDQAHSASFDLDPFVHELVLKSLDGDIRTSKVLGSIAFRDSRFVESAQDSKFQGNSILRKEWLSDLNRFRDIQARHPASWHGLSDLGSSWMNRISYIFIHGGVGHFIGNMLFLLLFGSVLEPLIGGLLFILVFLGSGIFAAIFYSWMTGLSAMPLIGASGAVSGIMATMCILTWSRPQRFIYFLVVPIRNSIGFIYFPAWAIFLFWLLSDLAGYLGTSQNMGGVAYSAHLGGEIFGVLTGLSLLFTRRVRDCH